MDKEFCEKILVGKVVISKPGSYRVKVSTTCTYSKIRANGAKQVGIINFKAMSIQQDNIAKALYLQGEYTAAAKQGLSLSVLEGQYFPNAGQYVIIEVEEKTTSKGVHGLFVTECSVAPCETPKKRSVNEFLESLFKENQVIDVLDKEEKDEINIRY